MDTDQIGEADRDIAREIDREVGNHVAVGIAPQRRDTKRRVVEIVELAGDAVETGGGDKLKQIYSGGTDDRIDPAEVHAIHAGRKIGDPVVPAAGGGAVAEGEHERVRAAAAGERVDAAATDQPVISGTADQGIVAAAAGQRTAGVVGDQRVVAAATDGLFDGRAERNADVVDETAH